MALRSPAAFGPADAGLFDGAPTGFVVFFALVGTLVAAGMVLVVVSMVRNARRLRQAGIDPLTAQADLTVRLQRSALLAGEQSLEDRLSDLDRLHEQGRISHAEHVQARAALLGGAR
ncbi:MAG: hypothetical protein M3211_13365 [Actinomycetota bacterium]|nr:hypothetical protein [Actinomycetota bacterium]